MKILGATWYTEMNADAPIGVVLVRMNDQEAQEFDIKGNEAAFIGNGLAGNQLKDDVKKIVTEGAKFPLEIAKLLLNIK